jgi:hypothetical protein
MRSRLWRAGLGLAAVLVGPQLANAGPCETRAGQAWGFSKEFAQYESFLIIRQVTGNWPFQSDQISEPKYRCKEEQGGWSCLATAQVCRP